MSHKLTEAIDDCIVHLAELKHLIISSGLDFEAQEQLIYQVEGQLSSLEDELTIAIKLEE